ncbi:leucine-rich repeat-containing protein 59 [Copidosoma floridanum]|uniref:leucine-rich repeat-containing protein 59 n=1 Tax=Copidosoma floridanum TaxID=29053 RepID=UPI0006C946FE|nr:leucine-rich repeat-containing protein 59 [Copidosoma floridanum]XP_023244992.1 leucine-rich repeat-containing protein 59 [Copidosoma floridanum]
MTKKWTVKDIKDKLDEDVLDLSLCDLDEVPVKEIAQVKRFTELDLSNNVLVTLPKNFATLTQIVKLDLSKNMLTEIPENFGELKMLRHLDLYGNKITRLPMSLGELRSLKWLDLKENPLIPAFANIAGPCSNSSECQACAKNIVSYLANVKVTVEEEKQRRLTAVQETEKTTPSSKKESKKKKKAEKKVSEKASPSAKKDVQEKNYTQVPPKVKIVNDHYVKKKNSNGVCSLLCYVFMSLIKWTLLFVLLAITIFAVFPYFYPKPADEFFNYVETETGLQLKPYHLNIVAMSEVFIDNANQWTNHIRDYLEKTYEEYFLEEPSQEKNF